MPGAGAAGIGAHVEGVLRTLPDLHAMVVEGLRELDTQARQQYARAFVEVGEAERAALVAMQGFSYALVPHAYVAYYQQDRVLEAIGIEPRPPHPEGYAVPPSDLSLLDPVKARGPAAASAGDRIQCEGGLPRERADLARRRLAHVVHRCGRRGSRDHHAWHGFRAGQIYVLERSIDATSVGSRRARPSQASAPNPIGKTVSKMLLPARRCVATAPPRYPVRRTAPRTRVRGTK